MNSADLKLSSLLSIAHLQMLQDNFANLTGIVTVLVNPEGEFLTSPSDKWGVIRRVLDTDQGRQRVMEISRDMCLRNCKTLDSASIRLGEYGVIIGAVPIRLGDRYMGSWMVYRVDGTKDSTDRFCRWIAGYDTEEEAIGRIRTLLSGSNRLRFEDVFTFFEALTETVIQLAQGSYHVMQNNESLLQLTEQLESANQMLTRITNSVDVGMYVTDYYTGELLQVNEQSAHWFGAPAHELAGTFCWSHTCPEYTTFCPDCPHDRLLDPETGRPGPPVVWDRYNGERDQWTRFSNQAIYWVDGRLAHMVTCTDITRTRRMQEQLARLAYYDDAMDLPNSLKLLRDLQDTPADSHDHLISFDILSLRSINDVYSRAAGDVLLQNIAAWVGGLEVPEACLYRIDGDEFTWLIRNMGREEVLELAGRLVARFEQAWAFTVDDVRISLFCNVTAGVIHFSHAHDFGGKDLLSMIERTLTTARENNGLAVYDEEMDQQFNEHLKLEMSLRTCIREGMLGFEVHYQPIVDPVSGTWCSLEALCRWNSPDCGPVSPLVFIHEAEQMGLITLLGRWVLDTAVRQCKEWGLDRLEGFLLDVNLSPAQMTDESLVSSVIEILDRYQYPGEKLSLEITESAEMNFSNHTLHAIERLRSVNVQVALDDFGTGYSSFNNLKQLPVSILKTERAFLQDIENDSYLQYLFYVMVELAHAADMKIVAEGVENEEQMRILLKNGVDYLQGYLFSRPLSAEDLGKQLGGFTRVSSVFYRLHREKIDMQLLLENKYTVTPNIYNLLNKCMQTLLSTASLDTAINDTLKTVGARFGVSRAYIFWAEEESLFTGTHEWCAYDVRPRKMGRTGTHLPMLTESWIPLMQDKGILLAADIRELPEDIFQALAEQDTLAIAAVPIWQGDVLRGFVGFEDCWKIRDWLPEEVLMLHNLGMLVASLLEKRSLEQELIQHSRVMGNVLDGIDLMVFVTGLDSNDILFYNKKVRDLFGDLTGRPCWVLHGREQRCDICPKEWLKTQPLGTESHVEFYNEKLGKYLCAYDRLIEWKRGEIVHIAYTVDITETKAYEQKLRESALLDGLAEAR